MRAAATDALLTWLADFEDDEVTAADVGFDHGVATDLEGEALGGARDAEGVHIDGDAAVGLLDGIAGHASWDGAKDGYVDDLSAVEVFREYDGACFVGMPLDDAFFFQRAEVAHGGGLTGEAEVPLNVTRGGHHAVDALSRAGNPAVPVGAR